MRIILVACAALLASAAGAAQQTPAQEFAAGALGRTGAKMTLEPQARVGDVFVNKVKVKGPCQVTLKLRVVRPDRTFFDQDFVIIPSEIDYFEPRVYDGNVIIHSTRYQNDALFLTLFTTAKDGRGINTVAAFADSFNRFRNACTKV